MTDDRPEAGPALRNMPARRWSGHRLRIIGGLLKLTLGAAIAAVLLAGTVHTLRTWALPTAPEPFDVASFQAQTVPPDQDAYVAMREVRQYLEAKKEAFGAIGAANAIEWAAARPEARAWVVDNRPALELWRRAAERPDAMPKPPGSLFRGDDPTLRLHLYFWSASQTALLEAGRLEDACDPAAAWDWHRARLRAFLLMSRRGSFLDRWSPSIRLGQAAVRAQGWADRKDVTVPILRRALADLEAMAPLLPSAADTIKAEYLNVMRQLDNPPEQLHQQEERQASQRRPGYDPANPSLVEIAAVPLRRLRWAVEDYLSVEPERSRRAARLVFANWLAHADWRSAGTGRAISSDPLVFGAGRDNGPLIGPEGLAKYAASSSLWRIASGPPAEGFPWKLDRWPQGLEAERRVLGTLYVGLAGRIYQVETGKEAAGIEQLVPAVVPGLPGFYLPPDTDDGTIP